MLHEFVTAHREEIIGRCRAKVSARSIPPPTKGEIDHGVPMFLDQLVDELRIGLSPNSQIRKTATQHGHDLLAQGFTVSQVVHDYGNVCQAITELAVELKAPIDTDDFRMLNRCLDDAIASAVTEYGREIDDAPDGVPAGRAEDLGDLAREMRKSVHHSERRAVATAAAQHGPDGVQSAPGVAPCENDRIMLLSRDLRKVIHTASVALEVIKSGRVGIAGSTGAVLNQSLLGAHDLIDRLLAEVYAVRAQPRPSEKVN
jgi:hypothetical protein